MQKKKMPYKGASYTPEYASYSAMIGRCHCKSNASYPEYNKKGIKICERWEDKEMGFMNFLSDMGNKPERTYTLERVNNDGDYCPENCIWADYKTQRRNQARNKHLITKLFTEQY